MLRNVHLSLFTDVSRQNIDSIFRGSLNLEDGTDNLPRNYSKQLLTTQPCVTPQKSESFNYTSAESRNLAYSFNVNCPAILSCVTPEHLARYFQKTRRLFSENYILVVTAASNSKFMWNVSYFRRKHDKKICSKCLSLLPWKPNQSVSLNP